MNVLPNTCEMSGAELRPKSALGWECPKCGAVMSPSSWVCINCDGSSMFEKK